MRFLIALARAQAVPTALGLSVLLVVLDRVLGAELLALPFLLQAVEAGRIFPALFAGCGAVVVALGPSLLVGVYVAVVGLLYLVLGLLATVLPKHWWLALPVLLYLQLYVPADLLPQ